MSRRLIAHAHSLRALARTRRAARLGASRRVDATAARAVANVSIENRAKIERALAFRVRGNVTSERLETIGRRVSNNVASGTSSQLSSKPEHN